MRAPPTRSNSYLDTCTIIGLGYNIHYYNSFHFRFVLRNLRKKLNADYM